jgi:hypothetical protein
VQPVFELVDDAVVGGVEQLDVLLEGEVAAASVCTVVTV